MIHVRAALGLFFSLFAAGYAALFRHPNNELGFCCYLIPGNPKVSNDDLSYWHNYVINKDPRVSKALKNSSMERMKAGNVRLTPFVPALPFKPLLPLLAWQGAFELGEKRRHTVTMSLLLEMQQVHAML